MDWLSRTFTEAQIDVGFEYLGTVILVITLVLFIADFFFLRNRGKLKGAVADGAANIVVSVISGITSYGSVVVFYVVLDLVYQHASIAQFSTTLTTLFLATILADLAFYWEHRVQHRMWIGWMSHSVHHCSPHFNMTVAYRNGPLVAWTALPFLIPLAVVGLSPLAIVTGYGISIAYQAILHTPSVGKLPRPIEFIMNTPSHHRVHHARNPQYIDKNYGGIFIIWDRMFGTFEEEQEEVAYGITTPINSVNPLVISFHGFIRLFQKMRSTGSFKQSLEYLIRPPEWQPEAASQSNTAEIQPNN